MSDLSAEPYNPQGGWFASILFVVVFCYFWIGLNPLPPPSTAAQLAAYGESSNVFTQIIVFGMSLLVMTMLFFHPGRELAFRAFGPVALVFVWISLTIFFSDTPDAALRRTVYSALVVLSASAMLLLPRDTAHFARLAGICICFAVALSYFGVFVLPARGIHQASDIAEAALAGDWRGHFGHKNVASAAMGFALFFGLYLMKTRSYWGGFFLTVLAGIFLLNSGGKTSAAMLPAILVLVWMFERAGTMRYVLVAGSLLVLNVVILSVVAVPAIKDFVSGLGIDASFTDRASIWKLALDAVGSRLFTGYGFQSFWQTDALFYGNQSAATWAVTAANAHNAYLDQLINGGIPLLVLVVVWLVILPAHHASVALARGAEPDLTRLYTRIWMFALFSSSFESPFFENNGPIWFTMLIAVFGLRLQAYAHLVEKPVTGPSALQPASV
ncbi:O-antigen ligase family protein [Devosia sp. Leaf420]|uniref:O-antigen ligase family protein n=1 Tax=Devosia sp. Leaf420 TaxID=1736374 RepID=UPI000A40BA44|nr:O-antigen ligase [Devosia sp. Leaf420]